MHFHPIDTKVVDGIPVTFVKQLKPKNIVVGGGVNNSYNIWMIE